MSGSNSKGYDSKEYDSKGFDKQGYNGEGYDKYGYDREGYNRDGFNKHGYNRNKWDKDGLNNKGCYRTDYECCGNFKYKDEYNPDPYRHHVYGGDRPMGVDYTICDIHNHARCLGDPGGCKRMYAPGRERPKPIVSLHDMCCITNIFLVTADPHDCVYPDSLFRVQ